MGISASKSRAAALACLVAGLLPLVLVAPSLPGCGCAGIGCHSGATVSVDFTGDLAQVDGPIVTACFNDACDSSPLPTYVTPGSGLGIAFPDGATARGTLWAPDVDDRDRLEVNWWFPDGTALRAGDRYRVTVTASSGALIADKEVTALAYDKFETCSSACYTARFR